MPAVPKGQTMNAKQALFVAEYLKDLNGTAAAIRAGYSERSAAKIGSELLAKPHVQSAITEAMQQRSDRTEITQDDVLRRFWALANADTRDLVEFRRTCCRYCWGAGFRYQRTAGEMERAREDWEALTTKQRGGRLFDEKGGIGYHAARDANAECPECFGNGVGNVHIPDTRTLSPAAALLYAGVKQTRDGLEVKTHSQVEALVNVGRHLGLFKDKVEHTGKDGGPIETEATVQFYLPSNGR